MNSACNNTKCTLAQFVSHVKVACRRRNRRKGILDAGLPYGFVSITTVVVVVVVDCLEDIRRWRQTDFNSAVVMTEGVMVVVVVVVSYDSFVHQRSTRAVAISSATAITIPQPRHGGCTAAAHAIPGTPIPVVLVLMVTVIVIVTVTRMMMIMIVAVMVRRCSTNAQALVRRKWDGHP